LSHGVRSNRAHRAHSFPSDCVNERDAVEDEIREWNSSQSLSTEVVILPWRYELDSVPLWGKTPQEAINEQTADVDVVIAIFRSRLGTPTANHPSGTVEEILIGHNRSLPVHVYFATGGHPQNVETQQLDRLREFQTRAKDAALTSEFDSVSDLRHQIRRALERDTRVFRAEIGNRLTAVQQAVQRERESMLEVLRRARGVVFDFLPQPGMPPSDIGILKVVNQSSGEIRNFGVIEGKIIRDNAYVARWTPIDGSGPIPAIARNTQAEIPGRWVTVHTDGRTEPLNATIERNPLAQVEANWTDEIGARWTTDNRGGVPQLDV